VGTSSNFKRTSLRLIARGMQPRAQVRRRANWINMRARGSTSAELDAALLLPPEDSALPPLSSRLGQQPFSYYASIFLIIGMLLFLVSSFHQVAEVGVCTARLYFGARPRSVKLIAHRGMFQFASCHRPLCVCRLRSYI
jgi:hypothetical protein